MIDIKKLNKDDIGRKVIYRSSGGDKIEEGRITSWNDTFIFVAYGHTSQGTATYPRDLEFSFKSKDRR